MVKSELDGIWHWVDNTYILPYENWYPGDPYGDENHCAYVSNKNSKQTRVNLLNSGSVLIIGNKPPSGPSLNSGPNQPISL